MSPLSAALGEDDRPATWPQGRSVLDLLGARGELTRWYPQETLRASKAGPAALFSTHKVLRYGDGGGADCHSGGGDDSGYNSGGGYTMHQLQLKVVAAEELNALLVAVTALVRGANPGGVSVSNKGGWQSGGNLLELSGAGEGRGDSVERLCSEAVACFSAALDEAVAAALPELLEDQTQGKRGPTRAWINENRAGHYNGCHTHGAGGFSGVYYVSIPPLGEEEGGGGDEDDGSSSKAFNAVACGCLGMRTYDDKSEFLPGVSSDQGRFSLIRPIEGMLVLFPSVLEHCALPFYDEEPATAGARISVAFNI